MQTKDGKGFRFKESSPFKEVAFGGSQAKVLLFGTKLFWFGHLQDIT